MRRLLILAAFLAIPSLAHASRDWYVSPSGSGDGTSSGTPTTLSAANSGLGAGDRVLLLSGTYSTGIAPGTSGSSGSRITYMSANLDTASVKVTPDVYLSKSYVTVKNITFIGGFTFQSGAGVSYDSLHACHAIGGVYIYDADYCTVSNNTITGDRFWLRSSVDDTGNNLYWCDYDYIYNNNISTTTSGSGIMMEFRQNRNLRFIGNHCTVVSHAGPALSAGGTSGVKQFYVQDSQFTDNYWSISTDCAPSGCLKCDESGYWLLRDFSYRNRYLRDTVIAGGSGEPPLIRLNHGGSYPHTEYDNNFESCYFKNSTGNIEYDDGIEADTLMNNVFVAYGKALSINGTFHDNDTSPSLIDHNTFVSLNTYRVYDGAFSLQNKDKPWDGDLVVTNNIMYSADLADTVTIFDHECAVYDTTNCLCHPSGPSVVNGPFGAGVYYGTYNANDYFDGKLTLDNNLYWCGAMAPIAEYTGSSSYTRVSVSQWHTDHSLADEHSQQGDPDFADASLATFNPQYVPGSAAIDVSWPDGYVGADGWAPDAISDLALTHGKNSVILEWTAPADNPSSGTVKHYEVRRSNIPITGNTFAGATLVTDALIPSEPGNPECLTVTGLTQCSTYYFAITSTDARGNVSLISNSPGTTTNCSGSTQVVCGNGRVVGGRDDTDTEEAIRAFQLTIASSNPAGDHALLRYAIPPQGDRLPLELGVFDLAGRRIQTLNKGVAAAGIHMISWDLRDRTGNRVRPGLYFVRGRNGPSQITRTLVVQ